MEENKNTLMTQTISNTYTTISVKTMEEKKKLYNALEQCDVLLNDCEDAEIELKDFYVAKYDRLDEKTGEIKTKYRTIIFRSYFTCLFIYTVIFFTVNIFNINCFIYTVINK